MLSTFFGRNETFANGETRFGLRSKHRRPESDEKRKRRLIAVRQTSVFGRNDRIRTCDIVLPKHARYQLRYIPKKILNLQNNSRYRATRAPRLLMCRVASPRYTRLASLATRDIASVKTILNCFRLALQLRYIPKKY